jgi:hypothetical protein
MLAYCALFSSHEPLRPITQELLKEADLAYIIIEDRRIEKNSKTVQRRS